MILAHCGRRGGGWDGRAIPYHKIGLHIKYEPLTRPRTLEKLGVGGGSRDYMVVVKRYFRVPLWSKTLT